MEKIIPAVSSSVAGPLGVAQLPRLWLTAIAFMSGQLEGYAPGGELDFMLADDPQIKPGCVRRPAGATPASITAHNARGRRRAAHRPRRVGADARLSRLALRHEDRADGALVSVDTAGPLGIKPLPRLWAKALIHEAGTLPDSWRSGETRIVYTGGVLGTRATPGQGMDTSTVANASNLDAATIVAHNASPTPVSGEHSVAELTRMGYPDMATYGMYLYNDLADWDAVHPQLLTAHV